MNKKTSNKSKLLLIAATISWFWAVFTTLTAAGMMLPFMFTFKRPNPLVVEATFLLLIMAACFAFTGYGIRKQRKPFQWVAIIWPAIVLGSALIKQESLGFISGTVCIMLGLILVSWKRFI